MNPGKQQRDNTADHGERHVQQNQHGAADAAECLEQQNEYEQNTYRNDDRQPLHRALLIFELAAPGDFRAGRKLDVFFDTLLHFRHQAAHVAIPNEDADGCDPQTQLPADIHCTIGHGDIGDLFQGDLGAVRPIDHQLPELIGVGALFLVHTHHDAELFLALPNLRRLFATHRRFNNVFDICYVQSVARGTFAIDFDL